MANFQTFEVIEPTGTRDCEEPGSSSSQADVNPPPDAVSVEDVPPNGGYGWVCTACAFMINAHSWGINNVCAPKARF